MHPKLNFVLHWIRMWLVLFCTNVNKFTLHLIIKNTARSSLSYEWRTTLKNDITCPSAHSWNVVGQKGDPRTVCPQSLESSPLCHPRLPPPLSSPNLLHSRDLAKHPVPPRHRAPPCPFVHICQSNQVRHLLFG